MTISQNGNPSPVCDVDCLAQVSYQCDSCETNPGPALNFSIFLNPSILSSNNGLAASTEMEITFGFEYDNRRRNLISGPKDKHYKLGFKIGEYDCHAPKA